MVYNFNDNKKDYLPVTLADENQTKIFLRTPNKKIMEEFISLQEAGSENASTNDAYLLFAKVLSHNRTGYKVEVSQVEDFDIDDIYSFFDMYSQFISEACNSKN